MGAARGSRTAGPGTSGAAPGTAPGAAARQDGGGSGMRDAGRSRICCSPGVAARYRGSAGARRAERGRPPPRPGRAAGTEAARPGGGAGGLAVIFHGHVPGRGGGAATTWRLM